MTRIAIGLILGSLAALVSAQPVTVNEAVAAGRPMRPRGPETYGTSNVSYYVVGAAELSPEDSSETYCTVNCAERYSAN